MEMKNQQPPTPPPPHIAIIPSPGMGHLIPLAEFAKRIVQHHNFSITFIIPTDSPPSKAQKSTLEKLPKRVHHVFLPPVSFDDLTEQGSSIETRITQTVPRSMPSLRDALRSLAESSNLVALVVDLFSTDAIPVAREMNVPPYVFYPSTAMALSLFLYLPKLDKTVSCEFRDLPEPVQLPGCIPIHGRDLLDALQDRKSEKYKWVLNNASMYWSAEGIMVNSFMELEPGAIKALQEVQPGKPPIYPIGPLINMGPNSGVGGSECLEWLDDQPHGSVLFVSFGSGGTLTSEQFNELALGLEMSDQRFLWVVRSPNDQLASATYLSAQSPTDPFNFLPKGFLERIKGKGLVVPNWAPQAQILSHASTGGFLSHCGWNSVLESVVNGVPLIAWPLYAEQNMNTVMLTQDIKVALKPKARENGGLVERKEIARVVKSLIEGDEGKKIRNRMKELKNAAENVVSEDGLSTKALAELANKWKNHRKST